MRALVNVATVVITAALAGCASTPAYLNAGLNDNTNCLDHAEEAQRRLGGEIVVGIVPRNDFKTHAVLVVDGYVIDNGALAGPAWRVIPLADLDRHMEIAK